MFVGSFLLCETYMSLGNRPLRLAERLALEEIEEKKWARQVT